jgi:hypothetical protein
MTRRARAFILRAWARRKARGVSVMLSMSHKVRASRGRIYASRGFTTVPATSVSRKCRPWNLKVRRV